MSDPTLSDIGFKNKMSLVWTTLNALNVSNRFHRSDPKPAKDLGQIFSVKSSESWRVYSEYLNYILRYYYISYTSEFFEETIEF